MKKIIFALSLILSYIPVYSQWGYMDYRDGKEFQTDSVTYVVTNRLERMLAKNGEINRFEEAMGLFVSKRIYMELADKNNFRMGGSQYADGTPVVYSEYADEVYGIIKSQSYYRAAIYGAVRTAFSKEEELIPFQDKIIRIRVVVNPQGDILETSTAFPIWGGHIFQPEQIATLESQIRKRLKFELNPKAANFNYFEGQIIIRFKDYIEDMLEAEFEPDGKAFGEEDEDTIPIYGSPDSLTRFP